jgi:hypothetical protein
VSAMSKIVGNRTVPRLTRDRISPHKHVGVIDAAHVNDGRMSVGGLSWQ